MKKFIIFLLLFILSCHIVNAEQLELFYDNEVHIYNGPDVNLILNGETFIPSEGQMPPVIIQDRTLVPVREVFEKLGGTVDWDGVERKVSVSFGVNNITLWLDKTTAIVNDKEVELDVPAKLINSKTMVPVRFISENGGLKVDWNGESTTVTVSKDKTKIQSVSYTKVNDTQCVVIDLDKVSKFKYFSIEADDEKPNRIIVDIYDSVFDFLFDTINVNDGFVSQIRFGVQEDDVNRIVIDLINEKEYTVIRSNDDKQIIVALAGSFTINNDSLDANEVTNEIPEVPNTDNINEDNNSEIESQADKQIDSVSVVQNNNTVDNQNDISTIESSEINQNNKEDTENTKNEVKKNIVIYGTITAIKYSASSEKARIILDDDFEYEIVELTQNNEVAFDFPNCELKLDGPSEINIKNSGIKNIEAISKDDGSARIIVTFDEKATYEVVEKKTELQIKAELPSYTGVKYENKGTYAELTLSDVSMRKLTTLQSLTTKKFTIKYSPTVFKPGSGTIEIDDEFIKKISITSTKMTITDKGNVEYIARSENGDVIFTLKPLSSEDFEEKNDTELIKEEENVKKTQRQGTIIILDAGHGGTDPGAMNGDYKEKDYNLKVMLKLKEMLEDAGYVVYTTRESDETLTVNDRVYLASKTHPDAALYVSIHHNALDNTNYTGSLVMYCARDTSQYGITNKQFATYVLNELVDKLGTVNRGFIEVKETDTTKRVLTEVPMPSILCEIAFISNDEELSRIRKNSFQNSAAEAIFNGIQKTLSKMKY